MLQQLRRIHFQGTRSRWLKPCAPTSDKNKKGDEKKEESKETGEKKDKDKATTQTFVLEQLPKVTSKDLSEDIWRGVL